MLGSERITDLIPCHSDGLQHVRLVSGWNAERNESHCKHAGGLWIGRSRFQKPRSNSSPRHRQPTLPDHVNGADFTMAHEQGGVDPRAGCIADSHPPEVDSPRAQADGDRAPPAEDGRRGDGNQGLGAHDTGRAQGQVHGAQFESAHESHTRAPHQDAASCLAAKRGSR